MEAAKPFWGGGSLIMFRSTEMHPAQRRDMRRSNVAETIMPEPSSKNDSDPGSGTGDKVIWAENELNTNPFVLSCWIMVWYGMLLNCDVKVPLHVEVPSAEKPAILNVTIDCVVLRFCRLNGEPGIVQVCPAAGTFPDPKGDGQPAVPLIPNGTLLTSSTVVRPGMLLKLIRGTAGKLGGISGGLFS